MSTQAAQTPAASHSARPVRFSRFAIVAFAVACIGVLLGVASGPGYRLGWWPLATAFNLLKYAFFVGLAGLVLGIVAAVRTWTGAHLRGLWLALLAVVAGVLVAGTLYQWLLQARRVPPIHDITTDPKYPAPFVAVIPLRKGAANPIEYGGPAVYAQQQKAYPDIQPLHLNVPRERAFQAVEKVARDLGWQIDADVPNEGRLEATATTFWFGFKDDVAVRVNPDGAGSRVDVRSVSRIGKSDVGTNAKRVRAFLAKVKQESGAKA